MGYIADGWCARLVVEKGMRIISGSVAGTTVEVPKGLGVRPTPDLVRQAIFNSLGPRVDGARVLELFAGTGALSLECLSRGAGEAICIEKASKHAGVLRKNRRLCGFTETELRLRIQDVFHGLIRLYQEGRQFDLILADPPFGEKNIGKRSRSMAQQLLDDWYLPTLLDPDGLFVLGHARRDEVTIEGAWEERKRLKHGDSLVRLLRAVPENENQIFQAEE